MAEEAFHFTKLLSVTPCSSVTLEGATHCQTKATQIVKPAPQIELETLHMSMQIVHVLSDVYTTPHTSIRYAHAVSS